MFKLPFPNCILSLLILTLSMGLSGCSETDTTTQAAASHARTNQTSPLLGPAPMGLPPLGSTYEEFAKALPANVSLSVSGSPSDKAFEISPLEYYGGIKTARLLAQFKMQGAAAERYWQLFAITKLPWVCGADDVKLLFEREEPILKGIFEVTHRVLLPNGKGAVLSGISRDRLYNVQAECMDPPLDSTIVIKYQLLDPNLFAYTDDHFKQMIDKAHAKWGK